MLGGGGGGSIDELVVVGSGLRLLVNVSAPAKC